VLGAREPRRELDAAGRVLERVGDEVRDRLGEAQAVADDHPAGQAAAKRQPAVERLGHRLPAVKLLLEQLVDLDELLPVEDPAPAARRREVVERQSRAAQLAVEDGQALGRRLRTALHRREAQPNRRQRAAQLMARARDHLAAPAQLEHGQSGQSESGRRKRPGEDARVHAPALGLAGREFAPHRPDKISRAAHLLVYGRRSPIHLRGVTVGIHQPCRKKIVVVAVVLAAGAGTATAASQAASKKLRQGGKTVVGTSATTTGTTGQSVTTGTAQSGGSATATAGSATATGATTQTRRRSRGR
jgi:hypothetical protein